MRPAEVDLLIADPSQGPRAARLGAEDRLQQLVKLMVDADLARLKAGAPVASA